MLINAVVTFVVILFTGVFGILRGEHPGSSVDTSIVALPSSGELVHTTNPFPSPLAALATADECFLRKRTRKRGS